MIFTDTVTIYKRTNDVWARESVLHGVQLRQRIERVNNNGTSTFQTVTTLTIPASITHTITADGSTALVLGEAPAVSQQMPFKIIRANNPTFCIVHAIADNTHRDFLPHWKVTAT